jgi:hypothetical protein
MRDAAVIAVAALLACGCAAPRTGSAVAISLDVTPVPLDSRDPGRRSVGSFVFAGGIEIRDRGATAIFELSDLRVLSGNRVLAVSDDGSFFEARLVLDQAGRLLGLTDARLTPLLDGQGRKPSADEADAEGIDVLPDGDRLVSFEGNHRIWLFPADGSAPRETTRPDATFPDNGGMEALSLYPAAGPDAYLVGGEGGTIWMCHLLSKCSETPFGALVPSGFGLTSLAAYGEEGAFAMLARSYDPQQGVRIVVRLIATQGAPGGRVLDEMAMAAPLTVDNFEGIAVVPHSTGGIRLYLLSDDNGSAMQHTYLLAFDWPGGV